MKSKLTLYTSILSSLLLLQNPTFAAKSSDSVSQTATKIPNCEIEPEKEEGEYSPQQLQTLASRITMRVIGDNNGGSGTIIGKRGNKYLIVTNSHVIQGVNSIRVEAFDGKNYPAQVISDNNFEKFDLALLEFQTSQNYCPPDIDDFIPNPEMEVLAAGFSSKQGKIVFRKGKINQISQSPLKGGYSIGYTSDIEQGMSGGAIINTEGTLVGINGKSAYPILNTGYVYQDGSKPNQEEIQQFRKMSWGVPIRTFLAQINQGILTAYNFPLPNSNIEFSTASKLPPWLQEIESKAKQFTVRIDSSSKENGSGIIIAKEGDTYTVLTTAHVVCESENGVKPCPDNSYEVVTHDREKYSVEKSTIKIQEGVDLAVLKFKSSQTYEVATLADYYANKDDYVFTAGYPKSGNQSPWQFTLGRIFDKETGFFYTRESYFHNNSDGKLQTVSSYSLAGGYELVYTSITYGGMSGGAVLDSLGRVIGIHGRSEGEQVIDQKTKDCGVNFGCQVQLGYSLGIPVSTFLGLKTRFGVQAQKIENIKVPQLTAQEIKSIEQAVLSANVPTGNAKASQWLERGNQFWRLRRYKEAVKAFDEAIKLKPAFVHLAYYGKGLALYWDKKDKEAIAAFELTIKFKDDFVDAWHYLSVKYKELNQLHKAEKAINKAIQIQPQNPNLYNEKFWVLQNLERYEEAETAINEAIKIAPRSVFYNNRGIIYKEQKKWELALADYNKAIQINPNDAEAYNNRGIIYEEQKKWELALADYNKAIQINPNDAEAYYNRGIIYKEQKKWELALADYNKAIQINPNYATTYYNRGNVYYKQKKWELALADYNKAIQINPNYANAYYNRGIHYKEQKKWELALSDYNKAIQINPNYANAYYNRGILYYEQKKWELALSDYNKAIQINPNLAQAYIGIGATYVQKKDKQKAIENFQQAAKLFKAQGNTEKYKLVIDVLQTLQK